MQRSLIFVSALFTFSDCLAILSLSGSDWISSNSGEHVFISADELNNEIAKLSRATFIFTHFGGHGRGGFFRSKTKSLFPKSYNFDKNTLVVLGPL